MPSEIQTVIKLVFSQGQASVERGFNIKKSVNKVNISQDSVIARKLFIDHMQKKDLKPSNVELSSHLIRSVKASRQRYRTYLEEQKKVKGKSKKNDQIEILNAELKDAISKKERLLKVCKSLDDEFVELVLKAEDKDDMSFVMKANGIKRKNEETSKNVSLLEEAIVIISEKKRGKHKIKFDTRITDMFLLFFL